MTTVPLTPSELEASITTLAQIHESDIDGALAGFVQGCNTALAKSNLTLHRKFFLTERGIRQLTNHADRTRRLLKREADKVLRRRRAR